MENKKVCSGDLDNCCIYCLCHSCERNSVELDGLPFTSCIKDYQDCFCGYCSDYIYDGYSYVPDLEFD